MMTKVSRVKAFERANYLKRKMLKFKMLFLAWLLTQRKCEDAKKCKDDT